MDGSTRGLLADWLGARWQRAGLATKLLAVIEPSTFLVSVLLLAHGWLYFLGVATVIFCGALIGRSENSDAGRTIWQLYLIDVLLHVLGCVHYLARYYWFENFPAWAGDNGAFVYDALSVSLNLAKVLAIMAAVAVPGQAGWPNLIPGTNHLRDIPGSKAGDRFVYGALVGCIPYGFWIKTQDASVSMAVWIIPALLALLVDVGRAKGVTASVHGMSGRTLEFAARYEAMCTEEKALADSMINAVHETRRELEKKKN